MQNRPQDALSFLESAINEDPAHVQAFLYLGIAYLQVNRVDDAISAYTQILPRSGREAERVAFNLGNAYFIKGEHDLARQYYSQAIDLNPSFASAHLNRANTLIRTGDLNDAIRDYERYLLLNPGSGQREQVLRLIAFIREDFAAQERQRLAAEAAAMAAQENARIAEENARAEAERQRIVAEAAAREAEEEARLAAERRRRLLEEVSESLQAAAVDSRGLSVGTDNVHEFDSIFELD